MSRSLPIALVQTEPQCGGADVDEFATDVTSVLRRFPGTRLVVYPELHLYGGRGDEQLAEPLTGPRATELATLAGDLGVWLVPGTLCEQAPDHGVYNTAVVFSPEGRLAAAYRKCFPWRPYEKFVPGSEFVVFDLPGIGRAGLSICYDSWFPEVTRQLAWQGAEFVITPTRTTTRDRCRPEPGGRPGGPGAGGRGPFARGAHRRDRPRRRDQGARVRHRRAEPHVVPVRRR
jgi:predicted amidohydrolase